MKKILIILMASFMCLSLFACGKNADKDFNVDLTDEQGNPTPAPESIYLGRHVDVDIVEITEDNINIRTGAGTDNEIIGVAQTGHKYVLIKEGSSWNEIEYNGVNAYVFGEFCQKSTVDIEALGDIIAQNENIVADGTTDDTAADDGEADGDTTDSTEDNKNDSDDPETI